MKDNHSDEWDFSGTDGVEADRESDGGKSSPLEENVFKSETGDLEKELARWIFKMTDKEVADKDRWACEQWLARSEVHRTLYNDFMTMWNSPAFELALRAYRR